MSNHKNKKPFISIVVPVYNNNEYLSETIESGINQTYDNFEVILHDDCSSKSEVRSILKKYSKHPRIKVSLSKKNEGISMATNRAILLAKGDYIAFLDCDDLLFPNALERAVQYINKNPDADFFYSNRLDINENGNLIENVNFIEHSHFPPNKGLLNGMYTSHLKLINKKCFLETGLFDSKFDTCQDYDMALRMSEKFKFCFIPEYLYKYRIHKNQVSSLMGEKQESLAKKARKRALFRRQLIRGFLNSKSVSIIMLTFNRPERTYRTLKDLYLNTTIPFELIIVDNNSNEETRSLLRKIAAAKNNIRLVLEESNLGCAGGRQKGLTIAKGDYIVMLDNDISVLPRWLENLIIRVEQDDNIAAACCKVLFPNSTIQFNGGTLKVTGRYITFDSIDGGRPKNSMESLIERDCLWLPGGATIYKRWVFNMVSFPDFEGAYEDNDLSLQIRSLGFRLVNCPLSKVVHHHINFEPEELTDKEYSITRYSKTRLYNSWTEFYLRNNLIIYDPWLYRLFGFPEPKIGYEI